MSLTGSSSHLQLVGANPHRLKKTVKSAIGYSIWQDLETVAVHIAVTLASTDKLHAERNIQRLTESLPQVNFSLFLLLSYGRINLDNIDGRVYLDFSCLYVKNTE